MKSSRYSALYAFTLSALLLALLKSHSLVLYWQQSRHILLDVAPPPAVSEWIGVAQLPDLLAPWQDAQAWLLEQGRSPWPAKADDEDELLAADDAQATDETALPDVTTAAAPSEATALATPTASAKNTEVAKASVSGTNATQQTAADTSSQVSTTAVQATTAGVNAKHAADATAKLIAAQTGKPAKSSYTESSDQTDNPLDEHSLQAVQPAATASSDGTAAADHSPSQSSATASDTVTATTSSTSAAQTVVSQSALAAADTASTATTPASSAAETTAQPSASTVVATLNSIDAAGHIELQQNDRVLLIGDSLMQGLAPHLVARFNRKHQIQTVDMSKHSTGLTYPAFYNWPEAVRDAFEKQSFNVLIVFMGANDPWDMTIKGKYIRFASPSWNEIYSQRVRSILDIAKAHNSRVIWLSTPPMGRDDIKEKIPQLNQIYQAEIANYAGNARFIDTAPVLTTDGVTYTRFIELPERGSVMLRTDDGIHFTTQGHKLLSKLTLVQFKLPEVKKKS